MESSAERDVYGIYSISNRPEKNLSAELSGNHKESRMARNTTTRKPELVAGKSTPLTVVESNYFGPTLEHCFALIEKSGMDFEPEPAEMDRGEMPVPPHIREMIRQRVEAREAFRDIAQPGVGQVVLIDVPGVNRQVAFLIADDGTEAMFAYEEPVPTDYGTAWYGFLVAPENEMAYMSPCDHRIIAQSRDPLAGFSISSLPGYIRYLPGQKPLVIAQLTQEELREAQMTGLRMLDQKTPGIVNQEWFDIYRRIADKLKESFPRYRHT